MVPKFAPGQKVRFNRRCVLSPRVPKNSQGYTHAVLIHEEGEEYTGSGVIEKGTEAVVVDYASHGTQTSDTPIIRVLGVNARCHQKHLDAF